MLGIPWDCRVFPHEDADGPGNMARDEALLELVSREPEAAALRTYGWTEPTLSLGYFQRVDEARREPRWRTVPLVRRLTGGGAIWHDQELTYALAIPRAHPLSRRSGELYQAVHEAIAALLAEFGAAATRRGEENRSGGDRPFLCFSDQDANDIVIGSSKVVGSAQRRRSGAILQHGSLLLRRSRPTPELPGAADLSSAPGDLALWSGLVQRRLPESLGFVARPQDWPDAVLSCASRLEATIYRDDRWIHKR